MCVCVCVCPHQFLHQCFIVFLVNPFASLILYLDIRYFVAIVNGIAFLISCELVQCIDKEFLCIDIIYYFAVFSTVFYY